MRKRLLFCFLAGIGTAGPAPACEPGRAVGRLAIPNTGYVVEPGSSAIDRATGLPRPELIAATAKWLTAELGLPAMREPPRFAIVPPSKLVELRLRGASADPAGALANARLDPGDVVAIYDRHARTIYLPDGWSGGTPAELSMVVHEMVHHLQSEAGQKAACPEVLEGPAFDAQARWLSLFCTDLASEFGLDPFTLLVRTNCGY